MLTKEVTAPPPVDSNRILLAMSADRSQRTLAVVDVCSVPGADVCFRELSSFYLLNKVQYNVTLLIVSHL